MTSQGIKILLVEDNPADARLVKEMMKDAAIGSAPFDFDMIHAKTLSEAKGLLSREDFSIALIDLELPDSRGLETFLSARASAPSVPIVVLTGLADEAMAVKAVQAGAQDYLVKGQVDENMLLRAVRFALERQKAMGRQKTTGKANEAEQRLFAEMVGSSPRFKEVLGLISTVARTSTASVLINGETGTGKELAANAIHYLSSRREAPFIKVNCSAIPDTLLETELFGYEKGAFTDAKQSKKGLFELADGGSIFLDEIGDMDLRLQPKLLQILENRAFRRVGGLKDIHVDVRVVAATNKDLESMVREKLFREDLFYRLKVMVINLPPLRERKDDILALAEHFLRESGRAAGGAVKILSPACHDKLSNYHWPGNIRELKNTIERAFILAHESGEIMPEHLLIESGAAGGKAVFSFEQDMSLDDMERRYVRHILEKTGGNKSRAAEILGISRLTLREKLKDNE